METPTTVPVPLESTTERQPGQGASRGRGQPRRRPNPRPPANPQQGDTTTTTADGSASDQHPRPPRQRPRPMRNQNRGHVDGSSNTPGGSNNPSGRSTPNQSAPVPGSGSSALTSRGGNNPRRKRVEGGDSNSSNVNVNGNVNVNTDTNVNGSTSNANININNTNTNTTTTTNSNPNPRNRNRKQPTHPSSSSSPSSSTVPIPTDGSIPKPSQSTNTQQNRRRANFGSSLTKPDTEVESSSSKNATGKGKGNARNANANAHANSNSNANANAKGSEGGSHYRAHLPQGDDLTSTLIRGLSTPPFPDCLICFSPLRPEQAIWSCSPSLPVISDLEQQQSQQGAQGSQSVQGSQRVAGSQEQQHHHHHQQQPQQQPQQQQQQQQYCWKSFHVRCIRSWAEKSLKDVREAWRVRGEERVGDWRCPGCQVKREVVPSGYWCFCNSTSEPKPNRLSTPHSCGNTCSRVRPTEAQAVGGCEHPCSLMCHPGPCPPCQVTTTVECACPRREKVSFRCGEGLAMGLNKMGVNRTGGNKTKRTVTCGNTCGRVLGCGKHYCEEMCHEGECGRCEVRESAKCWCGREEREVRCGEGKGVVCVVEGEGGQEWIGRFGCDAICERPFDCNIHKCQKPCHVPSSKPAHCPLSPDVITHCPCGKSTIAPPESPSQSTPAPQSSSQTSSTQTSSTQTSSHTFPARQSCQSPIPTCAQRCLKVHLECGHVCMEKCHNGECPPCGEKIVRPCRCGISVKEVVCWEAYEVEYEVVGDGATTSASATNKMVRVKEKEFLCDKPCPALRACGRHQCRRICCPLAQLALTAQSKKGKRRATNNPSSTTPSSSSSDPTLLSLGEEPGGLHECDIICNKMLSCGNHRCEAKDHKGPCGGCLRSWFEEVVCACGRTVLEPPVRCGVVVRCGFECGVEMHPSGCGHRNGVHGCHERIGGGEGGGGVGASGVGGSGVGASGVGEGEAEAEGGRVGRARGTECPPCVVLRDRECACGKKVVSNVKCSLAKEKIGCGIVCGKLMSCGFHHCERLCHADPCGTCTAVCGKSRKVCSGAGSGQHQSSLGSINTSIHHPCTLPCHAPAACDESVPCTAVVVVSCPCGRLKQSVRCNRRAVGEVGASAGASGGAGGSGSASVGASGSASASASASGNEGDRTSTSTQTSTQTSTPTPTPTPTRNTSPGGGSTPTLKCTNECHIAKRNARLADALGISVEKREGGIGGMGMGGMGMGGGVGGASGMGNGVGGIGMGMGMGMGTGNGMGGVGNGVVYSDELVGYAKMNMRFLGVVEKAFREFVGEEGGGAGSGSGSGIGTGIGIGTGVAGTGGTGTGGEPVLRKQQVLPHMTPERRKFVHDLAVVYRMDTQMVDVEPNRSVQIIRRIDTRIPNPTLSAYIASLTSHTVTHTGAASSSMGLGKLADLRTLRSGGASASGPSSAAFGSSLASSSTALNSMSLKNSSGSMNRGWTSVVSRGNGNGNVGAGKQSANAMAWLQQPVGEKSGWRSGGTGSGSASASGTAGGSVGAGGSGSGSGSGGGGGGAVKGAYRHPNSLKNVGGANTNTSGSASGSASAHVVGAGVGVGGVSANAEAEAEDVPDDWEDDA